MTKKKTFDINFLRTVALAFATIGAIGSLYYMHMASRQQSSILLIVLFAGWILLPFAGLLLANKISIRWTVFARSLLYWLMIVLTIGSLVVYSGVFMPAHMKLTGMFLVIPLLSWIFIVITILIARRISSKSL